MKELFKEYYKNLKSVPLEEITESSHRGDLEKVLKTIASKVDAKITVLHEPKKKKGFGAPDFKISKSGSIIGYVENKKIDEDLNMVIKSDQIKKYKELSTNILITNYIEWVWIKKDVIKREILCHITDFDNRRYVLDIDKINAVTKIISHFFSQPPIGISKPLVLAKILAIRSKNLRTFLNEELQRQEIEHQEGKLWGLYNEFIKNVFAELTIDAFSDAFAQMLSYGLFLAKLNAGSKEIDLKNANNFIPGCFELIKELVYFLDELEKPEYKDTKWIIEEILSVLNNLDFDSIHKSLSFSNHYLFKEYDYLFAKDPYIYFYEDFLSAYDKKMKKAKGVYYTPPPIVNFIVRAINDKLVSVFNLKNGLGNRNRVTLLDFAAGTGTFLLEVFRNILEGLPANTGKKKLIIKEHFLKNIYGFEYLIAPYTVAHLKLLQFLKDNNYPLTFDERLQIFLTNTLEPMHPQKNLFLPALSKEGEEAQRVKDKPILVITGNPPYKGISSNPSNKLIITKDKSGREVRKRIKTWIGHLIEPYFFVDGQPLKERNPKWLNDDYVKFIRFAQWKMEQVEQGVVGIITNHSFLDNPTFRGMRQSLMYTFNQMYFLDLHGNRKKKERSPDGSIDENVFDIEQGVCISILIRKNGIKRKIYHADEWGSRKKKYSDCLNNSINSIKWKEIKPESPFYLFIPQDKSLKNRYDKGYILTDIFRISGVGITTGHDDFVISNKKDILVKRFFDFKHSKRNEDELHRKFNVRKKKGWEILKAWDVLQGIKDDNLEKYILQITYRPFDNRYIFYHDKIVWRTVRQIMGHMINDNIGLIAARSNKSQEMNHFFCTKFLTEAKTGESTTQSCLFPLYLLNDSIIESNGFEKEENFKQDFRDKIDNMYGEKYSPEYILGYIYAILYCSTFRKKYKTFLRLNFPRIPFIEQKEIFKKLSIIGCELIQMHLLDNIPDLDIGDYRGEGNHKVVKLEMKKDKLFINKSQYFNCISMDIYQFQIGGYKVIKKYLSYRRNKILSINEIENVENIAKVINYTMLKMKEIDSIVKENI